MGMAGTGQRRLFVGTYTLGGESAGIYTVAFDAGGNGTGRVPRPCGLRVLHASSRYPNPSYLVRRGELVYAAHELDQYGCLAAYAADGRGALAFLGARTYPHAAGTCFAALHPSGRALYGANYLSGSVTGCALLPNGVPSRTLPPVRHAGTGADPKRQASAHVHSLNFVPGTNLLVTVDLGLDALILYRTDDQGIIDPAPAQVIELPPGSGPRMLAWHPHLQVAALVNELANTLMLFRVGEGGRTWELAAHYELAAQREAAHATHLPPGRRSGRHRGAAGAASAGAGAGAGTEAAGAAGTGQQPLAAHAAFSPCGRFLYASARGTNRLVMFELDEQGIATSQAAFPCGGKGPRHFSISPDGRFLATANRLSNGLTVSALDAATGAPHELCHLTVPQPACAVWG